MQDDGKAVVLRISDREREAAVERLNSAVAEGRITWDEHAERLELVYSVRTTAQLAPVLADLGQPEQPSQRVVAMASKILRSSQAGRVEAKAVFGAVVLDLSGLADGAEMEVVASSFCGKITIMVSDHATVVDDGTVVMGKRALPSAVRAPGGPRIRLVGRSMLGKVTVVRQSEATAIWEWVMGRHGKQPPAIES